MPLPEFTRKLIKTKLTEYCQDRIPELARNQVKLIFKMNGNKVFLIETRPYYKDPSIWTETPVAQFRFDTETKKWLLYSADGNSKWLPYDLVKSSADFDDLLRALDRDPTGAFWG